MSKHQRLEEVEQKIEELKRSLPAHSIPTAMLLKLEELEEELDQIQKGVRGDFDAST